MTKLLDKIYSLEKCFQIIKNEIIINLKPIDHWLYTLSEHFQKVKLYQFKRLFREIKISNKNQIYNQIHKNVLVFQEEFSPIHAINYNNN